METKLNITQVMLLLSVLLNAFITYFIWKPLLAIAPAATHGTYPTQELYERLRQQFQNHQRQDQRPKDGYQGGEYIDFEEL